MSAETKTRTVYRISNARGQFSNGGRYLRWTSKGKMWRDLTALKLHLAMFADKNHYTEDCMVEEILIAEQNISRTPVSSLIREAIAKKKIAEQERILKRLEAQKKKEIEELRRLQSKYPEL